MPNKLPLFLSSTLHDALDFTKPHLTTCPACGLLCDDIVVADIAMANVANDKIEPIKNVLANGCAKGIGFFNQPTVESSPQINGKSVELTAAIAHAAHLVKTSQTPLFAGLSTDIHGFRAIYKLSQKTNASFQHINNQSIARNMTVLQSTGWHNTTLTEVKNRADVIICFGDVAKHHPRFFERFINCDGMFVKAEDRQVIIFSDVAEKTAFNNDATRLKQFDKSLNAPWILPCSADDLPSVTIALRALVTGKFLKVSQIAGIKVSDLQIIANKLNAATYAVLTWVAKDFDFNHAQLSIQNITETVAKLNLTTRAAGLPLGSSDGDTSVNNAITWLRGTALNNSTINSELIEHDLMIWVNSFSTENLPPKTHKPMIVLGNSTIKIKCDVFIPVATPGLDCTGTLFRVDSAVILPLKKVRDNNLPTLSKVMLEIEKLL